MVAKQKKQIKEDAWPQVAAVKSRHQPANTDTTRDKQQTGNSNNNTNW